MEIRMVTTVVGMLGMLLLAPMLLGAIGKTKALMTGRSGPPLWQPYFDLVKLLGKGSVYSHTTTWIFRAGPVIALGATLMAALFIPFGRASGPLRFWGDAILLAYLLALARFAIALAGMDTGSSFEGMGVSREVTFACLAEPAIFGGFIVLASQTHSLQLSQMFGPQLVDVWHSAGPALALVAVSLFLVLLAENARIPVDDPATHLELTMIHEVMVLDHGGVDLAFILYGSALKLFVFGALLLRLLLPVHFESTILEAMTFWAGMLGLAIVIGVVESVMARLRLYRVPQLLVSACVLSALGVLLLWI